VASINGEQWLDIVNRIVWPRLTCSCCERFVQAPLPSRPIERGRPGPGLLAHVLVSKYADHLPLYRQSDILETGDLPQRFFLTPKACAGILRRAVGRGKTLPPPLQRALQAVAGLGPTSISMAG
jgi:transposase